MVQREGVIRNPHFYLDQFIYEQLDMAFDHELVGEALLSALPARNIRYHEVGKKHVKILMWNYWGVEQKKFRYGAIIRSLILIFQIHPGLFLHGQDAI